MILENAKGEHVQFPARERITASAVNYWEKRAQDCPRPILRARYSALVWHFSWPERKTRPDYRLGLRLIDDILSVAAQKDCRDEVETIRMLAYALSLALAMRKDKLIGQVAQAITLYEKEVAEDAKLALWGFSFDLLMDNRKLPISDELRTTILQDMETRLERLYGSQIKDPYAILQATTRLARFYRLSSRIEEHRKVLLLYRDFMRDLADRQKGLVAQHFLTQASEILVAEGLKDEASALESALRDAGEKALDEMTTFTAKVEITDQEMEGFINEMISGPSGEVLARIGVRFYEDPERVKAQLKKHAAVAPTLHLISSQILDSDGRVCATVGPLQQDLDGHIAKQMAENARLSEHFLQLVLDRVLGTGQITRQDILAFLQRAIAFRSERMSNIEIALDAYLGKDYHKAVAIWIPEIEAAVRRLATLCGIPVWESPRNGVSRIRTLGALLSDPEFKKRAPANILLFLYVMLCDERGLNIRNSFCHGMAQANFFSPPVANRVFQILLLLATLQQQDNQAGGHNGQTPPHPAI
jgi:hypothetical protein